jgi:hypothetical protein
MYIVCAHGVALLQVCNHLSNVQPPYDLVGIGDKIVAGR